VNLHTETCLDTCIFKKAKRSYNGEWRECLIEIGGDGFGTFGHFVFRYHINMHPWTSSP
jgi:hypothetical protein